jgi:sucrose-6F-phosphate phosphohydrolase
MPNDLLITDVDGTLLGDDHALERFAVWFESRSRPFKLVYASGRFYASVIESVRTTSLPVPDAIIGGVGAEVRCLPSGGPIAEWNDRLDAAWDLRLVEDALASQADLVSQPDEFQSPYKVSYYLHDADAERVDAVRSALTDRGVRADVVYSSNRDLDVLPEGVNKGAAASFLAERWGFGPDQVMVAGDSGNDASMFDRGFRGIVVANALPELRDRVDESAYLAGGSFAAGVLEGIEHWTSASTSQSSNSRSVTPCI